MVGFRPTDELNARLETAKEVTGKDLTHLVVRCVEQCLDAVVLLEVEELKAELARRKKATREFLKHRKAA